MATYAQVGSGTNPNSIASGAITFTQSGTTLTASAGFFTSAMVNGIFKFGTGSGGQEIYITAFTDTTHVTVSVSQTVSTPTVGTVWQVQQTQLQTFLFTTNTYQTLSGDCQTTATGSTITHKRTFIIAAQASPYTVNEIGYNPTNSTTRCLGRIVLSSSDVVGTSNFYVIIINVTITGSPAAPSAVSNVGTNINTAGNAMIERWNCETVTSSGGTTGDGILDRSASANLRFPTVTYTQNSTIQNPGTLNWGTGLTFSGGLAAVFTGTATAPGTFTYSTSASITTAGESLFGIGLVRNGETNPAFDVKFTSTQTAPTGNFQPITTFQFTYGRTLVN